MTECRFCTRVATSKLFASCVFIGFACDEHSAEYTASPLVQVEKLQRLNAVRGESSKRWTLELFSMTQISGEFVEIEAAIGPLNNEGVCKTGICDA